MKDKHNNVDFSSYNIDTTYISQPNKHGTGNISVEINLPDDDIYDILMRTESSEKENFEDYAYKGRTGIEYEIRINSHIDHLRPDEHLTVKVKEYDYDNRCKTTYVTDDLSKTEKAKIILTLDNICREKKGESYDDVVLNIKLGEERINVREKIPPVKTEKTKKSDDFER